MNRYFKVLYFSGLFGVLFLLPQLQLFRLCAAKMFIQDFWSKNSELYFSIHGFRLFGKISGYRVDDTLGLIGFMPLAVILFYFFFYQYEKNDWKDLRIITLGIIPFIGFWIPLVNFFWIANIKRSVYYRLCYSSMFWITLTFGLYLIGEKIFYKIGKQNKKNWEDKIINFVNIIFLKKFYFLSCVTILIILSTIRSGPVYGKMDFIALNGKPWWPRWSAMIKKQLYMQNKIIFSDPQTIAVLQGVFNIKSYNKSINQRTNDYNQNPKTVIDLNKVDKIIIKKNYRCIINLRGFRSSWVPDETGHWKTGIGDTSFYYQKDNLVGNDLKEYLIQNPTKNCDLYY